ncbi:MAG: DUF1275 domain-containing protein [Lachnospiraceae bacterium]|nr:DUF1275 domain-containing protein [Lachnospiraceae bacterium]MBF1013143.1 DUF1275 domain-containing protein [Lachnospiraceae bacterium]
MQKAVEEEREFFLECEKNWVFLTLIMIGGYYGAYTFCVRGGVFCNAQTANIVLLGMALGQRNFARALYMLVPIFAYFAGTILSEVLAKRIRKMQVLRWDTLLVLIEIFLVIFLGALPPSAPDRICQISLNFICAMQFNTFRQNEGVPMATTFVTNHIRQTGSNLVKAIRDKDERALLKFRMHGSMILFFLAGAILSTVLCTYFGVHALFGALPILIYAFFRLLHADLVNEKSLFSRVPRGH